MLARPSDGFWAGLIGGILTVTVLMATGVSFGHDDSVPLIVPPNTSDAAAERFVDEWAHMRNGTWAVDQTFTRVLTNGRTFTGATREAQRPPVRVRTSLGSTTREADGKRTVCAAESGTAQVRCRDAGAVDFDDAVEDEIEAVRANVLGDGRAYDVAATSEHCFRLYRRPAVASSTWGDEAEFCFDATSGAPVSSSFRRGDAKDSLVSTAIRRQPSDAELRLPDS